MLRKRIVYTLDNPQEGQFSEEFLKVLNYFSFLYGKARAERKTKNGSSSLVIYPEKRRRYKTLKEVLENGHNCSLCGENHIKNFKGAETDECITRKYNQQERLNLLYSIELGKSPMPKDRKERRE